MPGSVFIACFQAAAMLIHSAAQSLHIAAHLMQ
jgi:hypothetical protein